MGGAPDEAKASITSMRRSARIQTDRLGPMSGDAAIQFVDERASDAHRQFEQLRNVINGRATAHSVHHDNDDLPILFARRFV